MSPVLLSGDIVLANQLAYGFKMPWMDSGYFESDPQVGDVVVFKDKNKMNEVFVIKRIFKKMTDNTYEVKSENETSEQGSTQTISRDQILSKAWLIGFSIGTTQDSISEEKTIRWNRFLTIIK